MLIDVYLLEGDGLHLGTLVIDDLEYCVQILDRGPRRVLFRVLRTSCKPASRRISSDQLIRSTCYIRVIVDHRFGKMDQTCNL